MKRRKGDDVDKIIGHFEPYVDAMVATLDLPPDDEAVIRRDRRLKGILGNVAVENMFLKQRLRGAEAELEQAQYDPVTGLMGRELFEKKVRNLENPELFARTLVVCMDLRGLKHINDTPGLGHAAGDTLLRESAKTLREELRDGSIIARAGLKGDEFWMAIPLGVDDESEPVMQRLRETFGGQDIGRVCELSESTAIHLSGRFGSMAVDGGQGEAIMNAIAAADQDLTEQGHQEKKLRGTVQSVAFVRGYANHEAQFEAATEHEPTTV